MIWQNKKTKGIYILLGINIVNATNESHEERLMMHYVDATTGQPFVRSKDEFEEKFDKVNIGRLRELLEEDRQ